jgi:hypothetical protein
MTDRERVARALWAVFHEPPTWETGTAAGHVRYLEAADAAMAAMRACAHCGSPETMMIESATGATSIQERRLCSVCRRTYPTVTPLASSKIADKA